VHGAAILSGEIEMNFDRPRQRTVIRGEAERARPGRGQGWVGVKDKEAACQDRPDSPFEVELA
jgi:hypothetical protein